MARSFQRRSSRVNGGASLFCAARCGSKPVLTAWFAARTPRARPGALHASEGTAVLFQRYACTLQRARRRGVDAAGAWSSGLGP